MSAALTITRAELSPAAGKTADANASRRMLATEPVLEGVDPKSAAETRGMDRRARRDRVHQR